MTRFGTDFRHQYGFFAVNRRRPSRETPLGPGAKKDSCFRRLVTVRHRCAHLYMSVLKALQFAEASKTWYVFDSLKKNLAGYLFIARLYFLITILARVFLQGFLAKSVHDEAYAHIMHFP